MKMHGHVTCKFKCIMGLAQSNPNSTQNSNKVNTHLKCMKHCYNAHVTQCIKFQTTFWLNPSQKSSKNFIDFEKSQNFPKIPKVRSKIMKMHDKDEESIISDEKQRSWDRKWSEEEVWSAWEVLWEVKRLKVLREIEGMRSEMAMPLYIETS